MADGNVMLAVKKIIQEDKERRYVVVSAPGKRFGADVKITDMLYQCAHAVETGDLQTFERVFEKIRTRFLLIQTELAKDMGMEKELEEIHARILSGEGSDYAASRGEYLSGKIMSEVLDFPFVDPVEFIKFDENGMLSEETFTLASKVLSAYPQAVIPGFYGLGANGKIKTFSRGGSDITGAIVARGVGATLYENWTDVSGFFACDPRIIDSPKCMVELSYQELRELSYMGANVLHSESIFPVRTAGIPIRICNTFRPEDAGTYIVKTAKRSRFDNAVTGIAGKKDFTVITIEKSMMNSEVGFVGKVLDVIEKRGISFEHLPSGVDTMSLVIDNIYFKENPLNDVMDEMRIAVKPDRIYAHENIALIATVGHGMAKNIGTSARLFSAIAKEGINVVMIDQGSSELNIIVGVENECMNACINAIYNEFFL